MLKSPDYTQFTAQGLLAMNDFAATARAEPAQDRAGRADSPS
jgi:hypothetical protein